MDRKNGLQLKNLKTNFTWNLTLNTHFHWWIFSKFDSLSHFSYAFLPDGGNYVWVRELSCPGCSVCGDANFKKTFLATNGCSNSDICGKWRRYPILKTGEKDPRKLAKNGQYDGKQMFVIIFFLLFCIHLKKSQNVSLLLLKITNHEFYVPENVVLRCAEYVSKSPAKIRSSYSISLHLQVTLKGKMRMSLKVYYLLFKFLQMNGFEMKWKSKSFFLMCNFGCDPKKHHMGCLRKRIPEWFVPRESTWFVADCFLYKIFSLISKHTLVTHLC